jgi:hypothetical protein
MLESSWKQQNIEQSNLEVITKLRLRSQMCVCVLESN